MSIIYDALEKVQKNINKDNLPQALTSNPIQAKAKIRPVFIYIFVVCCGLALGSFAYNFFGQSGKNVSLPKKEVATLPEEPPLPPTDKQTAETPPPPPIPEPTLVLNGVFFEQGNGYALINNRIAHVGDEIEHAKVKQITMDGVELEFEGKTIKLASPS